MVRGVGSGQSSRGRRGRVTRPTLSCRTAARRTSECCPCGSAVAPLASLSRRRAPTFEGTAPTAARPLPVPCLWSYPFLVNDLAVALWLLLSFPQKGTDRGYCSHNFLSPATMNMINGMRQQLLSGGVPAPTCAGARVACAPLLGRLPACLPALLSPFTSPPSHIRCPGRSPPCCRADLSWLRPVSGVCQPQRAALRPRARSAGEAAARVRPGPWPRLCKGTVLHSAPCQQP